MKRFTIIIAMLFAVSVSAVEMGALAGVRVGSDYSVAKKGLSAKYKYIGRGSGFDVYSCNILGGNAVIAMSSYKGRVLNVMILFSSGYQCIDKFNALSALMRSKYGNPKETREYKYPYEHGDGHILTALRIGKANIQDTWLGKTTTGFIRINNKLSVIIGYYHNKLTKEQESEQKRSHQNNL